MNLRAEVHDDRRRDVAGAGLLVVAVVVFVLEPLHGPVLLSFSAFHGLDVGDVVALPFLVAAALLLRGGRAHRTLLGFAERLAGNLPRATGWALIATGTAFVIALVVVESALPDGPPHAGVPSLLLALVGLSVLVVLVLDPPTCGAVFGAPLWLLIAALLAGFVIDLTHPEAGPVMGPTVLAALLFVTLGRRTRAARWTMATLLVVFVFCDLVALVDPRTLEPEREAAGGGLTRVATLGLLMCGVGILTLVRPAVPTPPAARGDGAG